MIPEAAVEAAAEAVYLKRLNNVVVPLSKAEYLAIAERDARVALEVAAPHMLSHEREETRLAHVDAVVNAETVDKLQAKLDRVEAALDHAEAHGNYKLYSADIRAAITGPR